MVLDRVLEGRFVNVRSVEESDAEFILKIRNDPEISKYLPPLNVTVEQQREWIRKQRADENSYYVLFVAKDGTPLGTSSVYDIEGDHGESGRYCSFGNAAQNIEATILFNDYVFLDYGLKYTTGWVFAENGSILSLNRKFGVLFDKEPFIQSDGRACYNGRTERQAYCAAREKLMQTLLRIPMDYKG